MTPRERADRAQELLKDRVFIEMMDATRNRFMRRMIQADATDVEAHHVLVLSLQILEAMKLELARFSEEIVMDNAVARQASWLKRAKSLMP